MTVWISARASEAALGGGIERLAMESRGVIQWWSTSLRVQSSSLQKNKIASEASDA